MLLFQKPHKRSHSSRECKHLFARAVLLLGPLHLIFLSHHLCDGTLLPELSLTHLLHKHI